MKTHLLMWLHGSGKHPVSYGIRISLGFKSRIGTDQSNQKVFQNSLWSIEPQFHFHCTGVLCAEILN